MRSYLHLVDRGAVVLRQVEHRDAMSFHTCLKRLGLCVRCQADGNVAEADGTGIDKTVDATSDLRDLIRRAVADKQRGPGPTAPRFGVSFPAAALLPAFIDFCLPGHSHISPNATPRFPVVRSHHVASTPPPAPRLP